MRAVLAIIAALGLASSPALAAPAAKPAAASPARSLSVAASPRAGTPARAKSRLGGAFNPFAITLIAAVVVGAVVLITVDEDESDSN